MTVKTVTILLVDDDMVDVMAVRRSFLELKIGNPVIEAKDGVEALERLRGENGYEKVLHPCLILLDLNMPRMTGIEFLEALRSDPVLRRNVVFVMTTSAAEEDLLRTYELNVAGYVLKQRAGKSFVDALIMLEHYWRVVEFPSLTDFRKFRWYIRIELSVEVVPPLAAVLNAKGSHLWLYAVA